MKGSIANIYLVWRKSVGSTRHIIGVLKQNVTSGVTFEYIESGVEKAKNEGFIAYTEFQKIGSLYSNNVLEIFSQRLIKEERRDKNSFYDFWEIDMDEADDTYAMLAKTMGLVPTDNFEFLAVYHPKKDLHFITEIAGLSYEKHKAGTIKEGDELKFELERNKHDSYAVRVLRSDGKFIGYVKKVHNRVFHKAGMKHLKMHVKAIDQNGVIKRVFVKVSSL
jgi:hypothetical protein